jgi:hypothetical protein
VSFFSLVLAIVSLILVNRSFSSSLIAALRRPKPTLRWILLVIGTIMAASLLVPWLRELFRFDALHRTISSWHSAWVCPCSSCSNWLSRSGASLYASEAAVRSFFRASEAV